MGAGLILILHDPDLSRAIFQLVAIFQLSTGYWVVFILLQWPPGAVLGQGRCHHVSSPQHPLGSHIRCSKIPWLILLSRHGCWSHLLMPAMPPSSAYITYTKNLLILLPIIKVPFECIDMDLIWPLSKSACGHECILVLIDWYLRQFLSAKPPHRNTAQIWPKLFAQTKGHLYCQR